MRRHVISFLLLLSALYSFKPVTAQELSGQPLSLAEAQEFAVKNNIAVKNARLDVLIQEAQNAQVTANAYPKVNAQGQFTDYIDPVKSFVPGSFFNQEGFVPVQFTPKYAATANITGSQVLFDGSVVVALQARETILELARQNGKLTEQNIRYNVQKAYHQLVIAHKQFDILKSTLASARDMAQQVYALRNAGFAEKIEVDRTDVQINNLATDSMRIANLLQVSENVLKYQMGMDIRRPIWLTDTSLDQHLMDASALVAEVAPYESRTQFSLLQTQLKLNNYNLKRYRFAGLPSLSAFGSMGYNYSTNSFSEIFKSQYIWSSYVGLQLNVPIFNGLLRTNQVREARLNIEKTKNNIENLKLSIDFQTETARTNLRNAVLQAESQKRNVALASGVLELARRKYEEGVGSSLEVSQAQTDFLQAQANYFSILQTMTNAEADLQNSLGQF